MNSTKPTVVVVFTKNNARVLRNPENIEQYLAMDNAIIEPDLSEVQGIPPHYWSLVDGKVVKKGFREGLARARHIRKHGAVNHDHTVGPDLYTPVIEIATTSPIVEVIKQYPPTEILEVTPEVLVEVIIDTTPVELIALPAVILEVPEILPAIPQKLPLLLRIWRWLCRLF